MKILFCVINRAILEQVDEGDKIKLTIEQIDGSLKETKLDISYLSCCPPLLREDRTLGSEQMVSLLCNTLVLA